MCFELAVHLLFLARLIRSIQVFCKNVSGSRFSEFALTKRIFSDGQSGMSGGSSVREFCDMRKDSSFGQLIPTGMDSILLLLKVMRSRPCKRAEDGDKVAGSTGVLEKRQRARMLCRGR